MIKAEPGWRAKWRYFSTIELTEYAESVDEKHRDKGSKPSLHRV